MNIIVNADPEVAGIKDEGGTAPRLKAFALRVHEAAAAYAHCVDKGAWPVTPRVGAMELNIPAISGFGDSVIYCVDRYQEFSIYDVDFKKLPTATDLRNVAMLATPLGLRVGFEALSWGRHVSDFELSWEIVQLADRANLGVCIHSFHVRANCSLNNTNFDALATVPGERIAFVQLLDFMWNAVLTSEERIETARHLRVFPGEGVHSAELSRMIRMIDQSGYRGDWSFDVFNDDYVQMPSEIAATSASDSAMWVPAQSERRSLPRTISRNTHP